MTSLKWKIEKQIPTLAVAELSTGIEFYERLGFVVDWRWPEENPEFAGLMHGDRSIMLSQCDPDALAALYFIVDDVQACHAHVIESKLWELAASTSANSTRPDCPPVRACQPPQPPERKPYGLIDFAIIDPWGHELSFGQPIPDDR